MPKIIFYRRKCIGCGACKEADTNCWALSRKDGKAILIGGLLKKGIYQKNLDPHDVHSAHQAKANCPVNAIKIE